MNISNKTLAVLLVIAIVISVGGAMINMAKLSELARTVPPLSMITGFGSTGRVNVSILTLAQVNLSQPHIDFGVGYVITGTSVAVLNSSNATPGSWVESGNTWKAKDMILDNSGTVDIFVNMSSDSTGATMIGGGAGALPDPYIKVGTTNSEANSCIDKKANLTTIDTAATEYEICKNLSFLSTKNSLNLSVEILVPNDVSPGNKTSLLTFTATERN